MPETSAEIGKQSHGPFLAPYFMFLIGGKDAEDSAQLPKVDRQLYLPYLVIRPSGNPVMTLVGKNELIEAGRYELQYLIWCCVYRKFCTQKGQNTLVQTQCVCWQSRNQHWELQAGSAVTVNWLGLSCSQGICAPQHSLMAKLPAA